jgi:endonuclease/exonuclease/phosphatase family metal-dependent hydrolase
MVGARKVVRSAVGALVALAVPLALAGPADAGRDDGRRPGQRGQALTAMSYNLYLGSPLTPALDPAVDTPEEFVQAVATIYGTALASDFPTRAAVIARVIAKERPDLIGLQEVTNWVAQATHEGPTPPSQDFLAILLAELEKRGLDYEVAAVSNNADIGPAPLVAPAFGCGITATDCVVNLQDRDVILVNERTRGLRWSDPQSGQYDAQQSFAPPVGPPVSFARGWASIEVKYRGERFRFVDTHLEVADFAAVQEAQAAEFLAGPARSKGAVVAVGDFNSAADGSDTASYGVLTDVLRDAWWVNRRDPGYTSGQNGTLSNPVSQLHQRIDLILTQSSWRTKVRTVDADVVGDRTFRRTPAPLWPSDHAAVVASLRLR